MQRLVILFLCLMATNCFAPDRYNIELLNPPKLEKDTPSTVSFKLTDKEGNEVAIDDLEVVHTKPIHFLIINPTLSEYHHVHLDNATEPSFTLIPKNPDCGYHGWADITPKATGKQEYLKFELGTECSFIIKKFYNEEVEVDGLKFKLSFDTPPQAGKAAMGKVVIEKDGKLFTQLEPVMGSFGHIVAFPLSLDKVIHVHPMGKEPETEAERGGPQLDFHIEPPEKGYVKLYVQVKVGGKDIFAPFGFEVK